MIDDGCQDSETSFGYETHSDDNFGSYLLSSTDHGAGVSQTLVRFLLNDSKERRNTGKAGFGSRTIPICTIHCKKDSPEIIIATKTPINAMIDMLAIKYLIDVQNGDRTFLCLMVLKTSKLFLHDGKLQIKNNDGTTETVQMKDLPGPVTRFWILLKGKVKTLGICELLAAFTVQGHHGHSS